MVFRTRCSLVSRCHIPILLLLRHHSQERTQATVEVRTRPRHSTCSGLWVCRPTSHYSGPLCRQCVVGVWSGAELQAMDRHCTMISAWVPICSPPDHGQLWTLCVLPAPQIRTPLNELPSSTAMLPVSSPQYLQSMHVVLLTVWHAHGVHMEG